MHHAGVLPPDAPDPAIAQWEQVTRMPVAVYGLAPQPALDELPHSSTSGAEVGGVVVDMTVSPSYTLWRVPGDRADPANLATLDAETLAALDAPPPWPRPAWLVASVERMRYPMVWEAVRTTWQVPGGAHRSLHELLTEHMRSILVNRGSLPFDPSRDWSTVTPALDDPESVMPTKVAIDGVPVEGIRIDVDDEVVGVAVEVAPDAAVTVALLRADLPHLELALATRRRPTA